MSESPEGEEEEGNDGDSGTDVDGLGVEVASIDMAARRGEISSVDRREIKTVPTRLFVSDTTSILGSGLETKVCAVRRL